MTTDDSNFENIAQDSLFGFEQQNARSGPPAQNDTDEIDYGDARNSENGGPESCNNPETAPGELGPAAQKMTGLLGSIGEVFLVAPAACGPFEGAPRAGTAYDEARDFELREDILAHGVIEPIILLAGTEPLQILSGNRRHAIVVQLLAEGMPVTLPARLACLDPIQAIAFAAAQNVGRLAPTPMQQARSIGWTLANVEPSQAKVAEALGISEAKVSRLALLAVMPDWVLDIVTDPETLSENFAGQIQRALGDPATVKTMQKRAARLKEAHCTLPGPAAARYLLTGKLEAEAVDLVDRAGTRHATLKQDMRGGLTIRIPPSFRRLGANVDQIHALIAGSMLEVMRKGAAPPK